MDNSPFLSSKEIVCSVDLLNRALKLKTPNVVVANAGSKLPMEAALEATLAGIMTPIFVGDITKITAEADELNWDISKFEMVEAQGEESSAKIAAELCGLGHGDILMKGDLHSDTFMKATLTKGSGLRTGKRLVHSFFITHPSDRRPLLISDAAVNIKPNLTTRKEATRFAVDILHVLGNQRPKVAFLSATEVPSASMESSMDAATLNEWATSEIKGADFSGPLALDLILSPKSVQVKGFSNDPVAGKADAIIVPDIVSGNAIFKALVYLAGGCAAGIVNGAKVPILLTSRSDPAAARIASVALATILSGSSKI